jgi:hypothetical protein
MSTNTHPCAPEEVMAFVDGELPADRAHSISMHIEQCAQCHEAAAALRSASHSLSEWRIDPVDSLRPPEAASSTFLPEVQGWLRRLQVLFSGPRPWALACLLLAFLMGAQRLHQAHPLRETTFAKYRVVPPRPARTAAHQDNSPIVDGANPEAEAYSYSGSEASGRTTSVDRATLNQKTGLSLPYAPLIARTVTLSVVVKDFDAARAALDATLRRHNGYAAVLSVATPQGAALTLQASLRIPAPQLLSAVAELKALGRVELETQGGEEVTEQHADLVARLKNSRETEERLQDVLRNRTGKVKEVLEVEEEIARVRGEIEQMQAQQQTLEHRVNFATIELKLAEEYQAQLSTPSPSVRSQLRNAGVNGFRSAFQSLLALVLFLAESGPTLLLWLMILSSPGWLLWRRYQRSFLMGSRAVI